MKTRRWWLIPLVLLAALAAGLGTQLRADIPLEQLKARWATPPSKFVEVDGMSIHYRDEGSGPTLVLVHGTGSSLFTWDGWVKALSDRYRIVRLDTPGFGLTGPHPKGDYRLSTYAEVLDHFVQAIGIDRFAVAGNSLGGGIAWSYAVAHPEKVSALVLVDSMGYPHEGPTPVVFTLARMPVMPSLLAQLDPRRLVEQTLKDCYGDPRKVTPALIDHYTQMSLRPGNRGAFSERVKTPYEDRTAALAGMKMPVLIMWGAKDGLIPVAHAERFRAAIPGAQLKIYEDLGHVPMEEDAPRTAQDAAAFLSGTAASAARDLTTATGVH
jgi:pimeloyl-ACP methyl ester carboxylesterase